MGRAMDAMSFVLELRADEQRGSVFFGRDEDGLVIVLPATDLRILDELVERFEVRAGLSEPAAYDGFSAAVGQARVARDRGAAGVTRFADVSSGGVLSALAPEARSLAQAELAPLRDHDAAEGTQLLATLAAWLENDCSHEATARALGVHRHTVRTRLAHIERLLARDLGSFSTRAELWAALRALDA